MTIAGDHEFGVTLYAGYYENALPGYLRVDAHPYSGILGAFVQRDSYGLMGSMGPCPDQWGKCGWDARAASLVIHGRCYSVTVYQGTKFTGQAVTYYGYGKTVLRDAAGTTYTYNARQVPILRFKPRSILVVERDESY